MATEPSTTKLGSRLDLMLARMDATFTPAATWCALWALRIASPTWWLADRLKRNSEGATRTKVIWRLNRLNLTLSVLFTAVALFATRDGIGVLQAHDWTSWRLLAVWPFFSRCVEVFVAFFKDAAEKLADPGSGDSDLSPARRVNLALASYVEIVLDFALVYATLPACAWDQKPRTLPDLISYSATTITTSGSGALQTSDWRLQALSAFEIFTGVVLLVVCFAVYAGQAGNRR